MKLFLSYIAIVLVLFGVENSAGQEQGFQEEEVAALLAPVFQTGKTYRFTATTNVYMMPPGHPHLQIGVEQKARYDVDPRKGGQKGVAMRGLTERLRVSIRSGAKRTSYDSLQKDNLKSKIGKHFESTVNRYVKMELNEAMKIVSHQEAGRSVGETPMPGLPRFGPEELVQLVNVIPQGFSVTPVKTGDEWMLKGKRSVGELGSLDFEINYRHAGYRKYQERGCVWIEFNGKMTGEVTDSSERSIDFRKSWIAGNLLFDPAISMTRYSEHNIQMVVNVPETETEKRKKVPMQQKVVLKLMQMVKK